MSSGDRVRRRRWPFRRHIRLKRLLAYLERELTDAERERVNAHLADCPRCRQELSVTREIEETAARRRSPSPPNELLEEVLEFRAKGGRVVLPTGSWNAPPVARGRVVPAVGALGLVVVLGLVVFLTRTPEVRAGASTLTASTWIPSDGGRTTLEFRPSALLAGESRVRVRGWVRKALHPPPRKSLGEYVSVELAARRDGTFAGEISLPPDAVYAAFVVEDPEGQRVDSNGHRFWEVLARDDSGTPLFDALEQQFRIAEWLRMGETLDISRRMTELYPDEPRVWSNLFAIEALLRPQPRDSLRSFHLAQFERLLGSRSWLSEPSVDRLAAMAWYARQLDSDAGEHLDRVLQQRAPNHQTAIDHRVVEAIGSHWSVPRDLLQVLEAEWWSSRAPTELLVQAALYGAIRAADPALVRTWADRFRHVRPEGTPWIAETMADFPDLRPSAADLARGELRALEDITNERRAPFNDLETERRERARVASRLFALLGEILASEGRTAAARDTLEKAVGDRWDPELFARLARTLVVTGDTAKALGLWARVEADPLVPSPLDDVRSELGPAFDPDGWTRLGSAALKEMRDRLLHHAPWGMLPDSLAFNAPAEGEAIPIQDLVRPPAEMIVYCHLPPRSCASLRDSVLALTEARPEALSHVSMVLGDPQPILDDAADGRFPVYFDTDGRVPRLLHIWRSPVFLLVDATDADGIRYATYDDAPTAIRSLVLLLEDGA